MGHPTEHIHEEIQRVMRLIGTVSDDMKQPDWCPEEDSNLHASRRQYLKLSTGQSGAELRGTQTAEIIDIIGRPATVAAPRGTPQKSCTGCLKDA